MTPAPAGGSLMARVIRSSSWIVLSFGAAQALRLLSNLILTRLLFPEAFGLMALVTVIIIGLSLFSDTGVSNSIAQSKRGDDPDFLDTAFCLQLGRGLGLWLLTFALAPLAARFYDAPDIALCLPIAGAALALQGATPIRVETAYRHLLMGRVTVLTLLAQVGGLLAMSILAWYSQSVLALAIGSALQELLRQILLRIALPGRRSRLRWHADAAQELIGMGKWIFLSTACFFVTSQGDRAILGKFMTLEAMGIYNVAFFLASFPLQLGQALTHRLMVPVYRDKPAKGSAANRRRQRQLRAALSLAVLGALWIMAWAGPALAQWLYDARYGAAGPLITLLAAALAPSVIVLTYDRAALAGGDTRGFFVYTACRALAQTLLFLGGMWIWGLGGGIAALGVAILLSYPVLIWMIRPYATWDPLHDAVLTLASLLICGGALLWHWDGIATALGDFAGASFHAEQFHAKH